MLFYLLSADELTEVLHRLGHDFDPSAIPATVAHYLARTSHGSTLSRVVHAWVLSRGDRPASWRLLREALDADLADPLVLQPQFVMAVM
jgi:trehalose/maltose hydrolase-like predicted phosphorylase